MEKVRHEIFNTREYWLSEIATEEFILKELPIFTRAEIYELKKYKIEEEDFNRLWILRCSKKKGIKESLRECGYFAKHLNPSGQIILNEIYKILKPNI